MRAAAGLILFYLGALNALLALHAGTCTQGDASRLWGGALSAILYALACLPLWRTSRPRLAGLLLIPALVLVVFDTLFAIRLWLASSGGIAACNLLENAAGYSRDGNEAAYAASWLAMSAAAWLAVALVLANLILRPQPRAGTTD